MSWDDADDIASILVPISITDTMIASITADGVTLPEDATAAWSSSTTYAAGARVHSVTTHRVYESLKDANVGKDPADILNRVNASGVSQWWVDIGPTNRSAMFDGMISSQTSGASPLVITLNPGPFNGFALFGIEADSISAEVRSAPGGTLIYTTGGDNALDSGQPADYYEYFFDPFRPLTQFTANDIEPYGSAQLVITLKKGTGQAKVGMLSIGDLKPLGVPERNSSVEPRTFSYISEDAFGNTTIVRRPSATGLNLAIKVTHEEADNVIQTVQDLLDVPVAVIGSKAMFHNRLSTFGLISGRMDYSTYPERTLNLNVKGFI